MISWRLEASNDLNSWICLDIRSHDPKENPRGVELLCGKGATSTWGIDPNVCRRLGITDGFSTFRIVQNDKNSN
jgi:hypothetical protein